jgi:hypothetical protein
VLVLVRDEEAVEALRAISARISGTCLGPKDGSVVSSTFWRMGEV